LISLTKSKAGFPIPTTKILFRLCPFLPTYLRKEGKTLRKLKQKKKLNPPNRKRKVINRWLLSKREKSPIPAKNLKSNTEARRTENALRKAGISFLPVLNREIDRKPYSPFSK
jgi:hypothetical protein